MYLSSILLDKIAGYMGIYNKIVSVFFSRIPVPDIFNERSCRHKKEITGEDKKVNEVESTENVSPSEAEDNYSLDNYSYDYSYDEEPKECEELGKYNSSVYEENQKLLYKELDRGLYCDYVNELETTCFEQSLLEIWMYKEEVIKNLSIDDILHAVNILDRSPYFGFKYDYSKLLGSVTRNKTNHITSARAALYNLNTVVNLTNINLGSFQVGNDAKRALDDENIHWQDETIKVALQYNSNSTSSGILLFANRITWAN